MTKSRDLEVGDRVRVVDVSDPDQIPNDIVGCYGTIRWITVGFDGERTIFEVELDESKGVFALYTREVEYAGD